jgi:dethiobiotin synthetase/adenosylmethionine--8-amino-7-oxononanoate aminotransferase
MRGYDIDAVVCFDDKSKYQNGEYLKEYFDKMGIPTFSIPWIPNNLDGKGKLEEHTLMKDYYQQVCKHQEVHNVAARIVDRHNERVSNIGSMASRTHKTIWHPFTQHKHVEEADDILVFDSAYGDYFQVKHTAKSRRVDGGRGDVPMLYAAFDGSASWWTQGQWCT